MIFEAKFEVSDLTLEADFGTVQNISDGGYERGYAEGEAEGYEKGHSAGKAEGHKEGQEAEYDRFWDSNQDNGERRNYYYWYSYSWNDECLNPKYPIICEGGSTCGQNVFYNAVNLTRIPVDIIVNGISAKQMFYRCTHLRSIEKLVSNGVTDWTNAFASCTELEEIEIGGSIDVSINFSATAVLTNDSVQSIIDHLKDLTGATTQTLTFHADVGAKLTDEQKAAITVKNWNLVY